MAKSCSVDPLDSACAPQPKVVFPADEDSCNAEISTRVKLPQTIPPSLSSPSSMLAKFSPDQREGSAAYVKDGALGEKNRFRPARTLSGGYSSAEKRVLGSYKCKPDIVQNVVFPTDGNNIAQLYCIYLKYSIIQCETRKL